MDERSRIEFLRNLPFAYAYYKLVRNEHDKAVDYVFLEVNSAFEKIIGLAKEAILGKKVTELPKFIKDILDWVETYSKIILTGEKQEFTRYIDSLGCWYKISAFQTLPEHFVTIIQDVTSEMEKIQALEKEKNKLESQLENYINIQKMAESERETLLQQFFAMFYEHTAVMLLIEPLTGKIIKANPSANIFYGYTQEEILSLSIQEINMLPEEEVRRRRELALKEKQHYFIFPHRLKSGEIRLVDVYSCPVFYEGKHLLFSIIFDVTDRERYKEELTYLSYHDYLTGLYNRRFMEEEYKRLNRARLFPLTVIIGDVNGLKLTNDVFGHKAGDKLLQKVAKILKESCRREDIIARWGGDEFLIFLPATTSEAAEKVIERLKMNLAKASYKNMQLNVSFGLATKLFAEEDLSEIVKGAEKLMYHQKLLEGKSYRSTIISTLLATLAEKSTETEEHVERLKDYCLRIAQELKLTVAELDELELLAILHDIGKIGISENILQKPGALTPEEWIEMKKHSEIGYRIAQSTPELARVAEGILYHHERWDGYGYPSGLKGEEIPLLCRILAVVDAYDAMTNNRVYRQGMSPEKAIAEIERNAGIQFDPVIVDIFVRIMANNLSLDSLGSA